MSRDKYGNLYRWGVSWEFSFKPFYRKDVWLDGGSVSWHFGFITITKQIVHEQ